MSKVLEYRIRCDACLCLSSFTASSDYLVVLWAREHGWKCERTWRRPGVDTCPVCLTKQTTYPLLVKDT